jgi:RHS repeat-associated protein
VISLGYDAINQLSTITGPGPNGTNITYMQFDYMPINLNFNNTMPVVNASQGQALGVLRHVYNPATNTGYLFSYSGYGVVTTVSKRRQMSVTGGAITDGIESANATFGYPAGGAQITGVPMYPTWTQTPGSANAFFFGLFGNNALGPNTVTYREIPPDYSSNLSSYPITFLTRSTDTTSPAYGLLTRLDIQDAYGNQYRKILYNYALDPGGSPQVQSITTYDETNTPTMVNFDYDGNGNVANKREFGYQVSGVFQVRRRTHTTYLTDPNYIAAYMLNRPTEVDIYDALLNTNDADDVMIAKKTIAYDQYGSSGLSDYGLGQSTEPGHISTYDKNYTLRGNPTSKTTWTDLTANTSITQGTTYDIFGNVQTQQVSCCQQKSYTFGSGDYYTNPTQATSGSGPTVTDTIGWDFNTDSQTSYATPANVTINTHYDNAFRPTSITWNPAGSKTYAYNDAAMSASVTINTGAGSGQFSASLDGWGRTTVSVDQGGGQVFSTYDPFGRLVSRTNPLPSGTTSGPTTTFQHDPLGRITVTTLPDGNTISTTYSGSTITATDEVGRKTQRQFDGLGRLIAVTEQDPGSGSLTQTTTYSYDLLDNLTKVNQGGQIRSWKYDAMGRMLYENIPEQSATINDGTGTMWTCKCVYNDFGLVTSKQDARGVVISYGYTGLNKVASISYNTSNAPGVAATLPVNITYDSAGRILAGSIGTAPCVPSPNNNCSSPSADYYYAESYAYDVSGNPGLTTLTRTIDTLNTTDGTLVSGQNYTTTYANDSFRKPVSITYPSGRTISYNRQTNTLRLASITEQSGPTYLNNISYNAAGQVWQFQLGNGVINGFIYDGAAPGQTGNRLQMTQMVATSPGGAPGNLMTLNYSYQASAGQLGTGTTAGNTGQLMSITGTMAGQTENAAYTYDLDGRLVTSSQASNGASAQRRFAYDFLGNRTGMWDATSGGNQLQNITLQQSGGATNNRLATVSSAGESVYNTPGQCGTPTTVSIGRTGRYVRVQLMGTNYLHLAEVQVMGTSGQNLASGKPSVQSSTVLGATASRANDGNTDGNFADASVSHTDYQNQPWWQVDLGSSQQISNVNVWNRTDCCQSRTSNFNVIVSDQPITTVGYIYDAAGNATFDGVHSYTYDAENRLVSVDAGSTAKYYYDFQNRRVNKVSAVGTTHYVWEGGKVLAEHDGNTGSLLADYIYSGAALIAKVAAGVTNYFISDRLSVRMSLDASGNVVGRQGELPFGEEFAESGTQDKHHFTSYESDNETGLDYAVNRQYSQNAARFMRSDPYPGSYSATNPQSMNRYAYLQNDPINATDPIGLCTLECSFVPDYDPEDGRIIGYHFECSCEDVPPQPTPPDCDKLVNQYVETVSKYLAQLQSLLNLALNRFGSPRLSADATAFLRDLSCFLGAATCNPRVTRATFADLGYATLDDYRALGGIPPSGGLFGDVFAKAYFNNPVNSEGDNIRQNCKNLNKAQAKKFSNAARLFNSTIDAFESFLRAVGFLKPHGEVPTQ